jgi:Mg2+ and Co2+ transporter CorA
MNPHSVLRLPFPINALNLEKKALEKLLAHFGVASIWLAHVFRNGAAFGQRYLTAQHETVSWDDPRAEYHHCWYSIDFTRDDYASDTVSSARDVELYSITNLRTRACTAFVLRLPDPFVADLKCPERLQCLLDEPYRLHSNLLQIALELWSKHYSDEFRELFLNYESRYSKAKERLTEEQLVMLHRQLYRAELQVTKTNQVVLVAKEMLAAFEKLQERSILLQNSDPAKTASYFQKATAVSQTNPADGRSESTGITSIIEDLRHLSPQALIMKGKFHALKERIKNLMDLNYQLLHYQVAREASRENQATKVLTFIAVVAVPTTLVSAIFGSNFVIFDSDTRGVIVSPKIWILFLISGGLTFFVFIFWYLWIWKMPRRRRARAGREESGGGV